ncbi:DUF4266 domain-containing protein [Shewanella mangrovisoli]|uniref:DUF4266 domain-containing protein n=1 Tax=Shewanella mangrovisoli TaxID=2864211 RepID=UPI0035B94AE6
MRKTALIAVSLMIVGLTGCSNLGVQPWEKGQFARADMALDSEKLDQALDDHIYFSKEGSSGGRAFAGGGCGCN